MDHSFLLPLGYCTKRLWLLPSSNSGRDFQEQKTRLYVCHLYLRVIFYIILKEHEINPVFWANLWDGFQLLPLIGNRNMMTVHCGESKVSEVEKEIKK